MRRKPLLGETTDWDKAFPDIEELEISIKQDEAGYYTKGRSERERRFTKGAMPRYFGCANPRCQQGGLDLQQIVSFYQSGEYTISCPGHEGSPQGRRQGNPCDNFFKISLSVKRREATAKND